MALTRDFRVKDSLTTGVSGLFKAGSTSYDGSKIAIDTFGRILSGGRDLADIFADADLENLTGGAGINSFSYDGLAPVTISLSGANTLTNDSLIKWSSATGFANGTLTDSALVGLRTTVSSNSGSWSSAYSTTNSLSSKWDSSYTTTNANSANWNSTYTTVGSNSASWSSAYATTNTLSSKWDSSYATTNALSSKWDSSYTTTNAKSASWDSVYSSYNAASGTIVNGITIPSVQGQFTYTELDGGSVTRTLHNLSATGSPTFANLTVTGGLSAVTLSGNGAGLTNVTATPIFPNTAITDLASGNFFFVNNDAGGATSGNRRITYSNLLTDLAGTGLAVESSDSLSFKNASGLSDTFITRWDSGNGQLVNSIIRQTGPIAVIGGGLSATGNTTLDGTLTVKGDVTIGDANSDTLTINSGPVNFPSALNDGDALILGGDANLYRSAANVLRTDDSLIVGVNLSAFGDVTLGDNASDTVTINAGPVNLPNATAAADALTLGGDVNLYRSSANVLRTDDSLSVGGDATITGNLSVIGDFTYLNTLVSVTSALSVVNSGTGPALYVEQTGINPIAQFVDRDGGTVTISDTGSVGIGTPLGAIPTEKLTVTGNISASGTLKLGSLVAGTTNSVVIEDNGELKDRAINPSVWDTSAPFISGSSTRTTNTVPKFSSSTGITNSTITDNGNDVTIASNVVVTDTHRIEQYSGSINFTETGVFTGSLTTAGNPNTLSTFTKVELDTVKYVVSLRAGALKTAFEVIVVYNGTDGFGTVYGLIDAQATSLLTNVDVITTGSTVDLSISVSSNCTAIVHGTAHRVNNI